MKIYSNDTNLMTPLFIFSKRETCSIRIPLFCLYLTQVFGLEGLKFAYTLGLNLKFSLHNILFDSLEWWGIHIFFWLYDPIYLCHFIKSWLRTSL